MRIEAQAIKLGLKVRGSPSVKGQLIQFVRKRTKRRKSRKLKQVNSYGNSYTRNYSTNRGA
jgi:hypothetical protein